MKKSFMIFLLTLVISTFLVISCGGDEEEATGCDANAVQCDGTKAQFCSDGSWTTSKDCATTSQTCEVAAGAATCVGGTNNTPECGNGAVESGEECDDGNTVAGDGCDAECKTETGTTAECNNGTKEGNEVCDKDSVDCGTLGSFEAGTSAACKADCTGYDSSVCKAVEAGGGMPSKISVSGNLTLYHPTNYKTAGDISGQLQMTACAVVGGAEAGNPYGTVTVNGNFAGLRTDATPDSDQTGVIQSHVFTGTMGGQDIFLAANAAQAMAMWSVDAQNGNAVMIQDIQAQGQTPANPVVIMVLPEPVPSGQAVIGVEQGAQGMMYVADVDFQKGSLTCVHALGDGTITVTK